MASEAFYLPMDLRSIGNDPSSRITPPPSISPASAAALVTSMPACHHRSKRPRPAGQVVGIQPAQVDPDIGLQLGRQLYRPAVRASGCTVKATQRR